MNISDCLHHLLSSTRRHAIVRIDKRLVTDEESMVNTDLKRTRLDDDRNTTRCLICKGYGKAAYPGCTEEMEKVFKQLILQGGTPSRENEEIDCCEECLKAVKQIADLKRQAQLIEQKINAIVHFLRRAIKSELSVESSTRSRNEENCDPITNRVDGDDDKDTRAVDEEEVVVKMEIPEEDYFEDDEGSFSLLPDSPAVDPLTVDPEVEKVENDDGEDYNPSEDSKDEDFELKSSPAKQEPTKRKRKFKIRKTLELEQKKTCRVCSQSFDTIQLRVQHYTKMHSKKAEKQIRTPKITSKVCKICEKAFINAACLRVHILAVHEKVKPHQCPICERTFSSKCAVKTHLVAVHNDGEKKCPSCDLSFELVKDRILHERAVHLHLPSFLCEHCSKLFECKSKLVIHQGVCGKTKEEAQRRRTNICNICGNGFTREIRLKEHIQNVHEKRINFSCHLCAKPFCKKNELDQHLLKQHTPKEERMKCGICDLSFSTLTETSLHNKINHLKKPIFRCPHCPAVYDISSTLQRHLKIHEVKPDGNESISSLMV